MTRAEKAQRIAAILDELHPEPEVPLDHVDPYTLLVSVLLSAQCTDERVNQVTPALFARAATPDAMAKLEVEEIRQIIRPCGLSPTKAKAIRRLSEILRDEYGGQVPTDSEALEALPIRRARARTSGHPNSRRRARSRAAAHRWPVFVAHRRRRCSAPRAESPQTPRSEAQGSSRRRS